LKVLNIRGSYLEVGAGPGLLAIMIAKGNPGVNITTIDLSPDMVSVAKEYVRATKLEDRIRCLIGDVNDENLMRRLGEFDFVYSTFSLHHWNDPVNSIRNLCRSVAEEGTLYIYDFKRVGWLTCLPLKSGDMISIRASYTSPELISILQKLDVTNYRIKTRFPFFLQTIVIRKQNKR
jgi:SAM-dependent methyltransferase